MQGAAWINLFRRIPANLQDSVAVGLVTGAEVVVQQIYKLEDDFVMLRGRMAGSNADARLMIVPYSHMTLIAINRRLTPVEAKALLGDDTASIFVEAEARPAASEATTTVQRQAAVSNASGLTASGVVAPANDRGDQAKQPPSKSILLARLRERLAEKAK
ncbi:MAG: hypothetical protein NZO58_07660 [Gemmataceae bacterium]|nr:hypothetical protein [Gemmataceae bacterium]